MEFLTFEYSVHLYRWFWRGRGTGRGLRGGAAALARRDGPAGRQYRLWPPGGTVQPQNRTQRAASKEGAPQTARFKIGRLYTHGQTEFRALLKETETC